MHYLNSTAINAANYNVSTGTLTLWFTSGGQGYDYDNVPEYIFRGLLTASSKGRYFNAFIRGQYAA
jgi:KTSC domain